jgi:hypothetical protein
LQSSPWLVGEEEPTLAGQIPATVVAGGEGEPARKDQGARADLAGGDVKVGVDRRGGTTVTRGGGDRAGLWWRCSGVVAHRRWIGGGGIAPGGQGGSPELLGGS